MSFVAFLTVFQSYQDNKERLCTRQFHLQRKDFGSKWDFNPVLLAQQGYCCTKASCLESIGKHIVNLKFVKQVFGEFHKLHMKCLRM